MNWIQAIFKLVSLLSLILEWVRAEQDKGLGRAEAFASVEAQLQKAVTLRKETDAEIDGMSPADIDREYAKWLSRQ